MYYRKYMHMCKCAGLDPRTARVSVTAAAARVEAAEARRGLVSTVEGSRGATTSVKAALLWVLCL